MSMERRVLARLSEGLASDPAVSLFPPRPGTINGVVDAVARLGRIGRLEWEAAVPVSFGPESVVVGDAAIRRAGGDGDAAHPGRIPPEVATAARAFHDKVLALGLQEIPLTAVARTLLDTLRDIAAAHAREDDASLAEAIAAGREIVLSYRPSLAALLETRAPGSPAP